MIRYHVKKLSNPRKVHRKKSNARKRRMTPKQIRHFGTKRQKAALKASLKRKRIKANPRRVTLKRVAKRRTKRTHNPALIVTLGATNPHRRRNPVAKTKRRRKATAHRRRHTSNPRRVVRRRRRSNPVARRRRRRSNATKKVIIRYRNRKRSNPRRHHRRNPSLFGESITSSGGMKIVGGALAGVVVAKFAPTLLPTSMLGSLGSSNVGKVVITGVSAVAGAWLIGKWDRRIGEAALLGGLMQTASVALNSFLPSIYQSLGIGLGDLMPGAYSVPQNPIRAGIAPPAAPVGGQARVTMNGLTRAYGQAF
jgi:hypothetical protein